MQVRLNPLTADYADSPYSVDISLLEGATPAPGEQLNPSEKEAFARCVGLRVWSLATA
jgi:hypothetical protein